VIVDHYFGLWEDAFESYTWVLIFIDCRNYGDDFILSVSNGEFGNVGTVQVWWHKLHSYIKFGVGE